MKTINSKQNARAEMQPEAYLVLLWNFLQSTQCKFRFLLAWIKAP